MNSVDNFLSALGIGRHTFLTTVGGGGKTSLLFFLSRSLAYPNAVTTTTKMRYPGSGECKVVLGDSFERLESLLLSGDQRVFFAKELRDDGKVVGYNPEFLDRLYNSVKSRVFLCEGDGSRGLPFKFHSDYEPVIPKETDVAVLVVGAKALMERMDKNLVQRIPEAYVGKILDPDFFAEWCGNFLDNKFCGNYRKILFINQAEGKYSKIAENFGERVKGDFDAVFTGSLHDKEFRQC